MSDAFFSILPAVSAGGASATLFLRVKKDHILGARKFFLYYAAAFAMVALASIPIFLMDLGMQISYSKLNGIYGFVVLVVFVSYLLFFRGTTVLFIRKEKFFKALPLFIMPAAATISLLILVYLRLSSILIYTALAWGFLFVNDNLLSTVLAFSFLTGSPIKHIKGKPGAFLLALGWFSVLILDVVLWLNAVLYNPSFWILRIISLDWWFLARAVVYVVILVAALMLAKHLECIYPQEKELSD